MERHKDRLLTNQIIRKKNIKLLLCGYKRIMLHSLTWNRVNEFMESNHLITKYVNDYKISRTVCWYYSFDFFSNLNFLSSGNLPLSYLFLNDDNFENHETYLRWKDIYNTNFKDETIFNICI